MFLSQIGNIIPPASIGSTPGSLLSCTQPKDKGRILLGDPYPWDINRCNAGAVLERCGKGWFRSESQKLSTYQLVNIPTLTHNHKLWLVIEVKRSDTSKTIPCWRCSSVLLRRLIKYNVFSKYNVHLLICISEPAEVVHVCGLASQISLRSMPCILLDLLMLLRFQLNLTFVACFHINQNKMIKHNFWFT